MIRNSALENKLHPMTLEHIQLVQFIGYTYIVMTMTLDVECCCLCKLYREVPKVALHGVTGSCCLEIVSVT